MSMGKHIDQPQTEKDSQDNEDEENEKNKEPTRKMAGLGIMLGTNFYA